MPLRPASLLAVAALCFLTLAGVAATSSPLWLVVSLGLTAVFAQASRGAARVDREDSASLRVWQEKAKRLEAELWDQRRAMDVLADGLDAALIICDRRGTIQYANPPAHRLFGQRSLRRQTVLAATLSGDLERLLLDAAETDASQRGEIAFAYPREWTGLASAWRDPAVNRVFVAVYEITELRRLERMRKDFVANVSHELRTPMTIIRGYAETLLDEDPPSAESSERMLPRIIGEVDRLSVIVQDLLTLSVAESSPVRKQECDLAEIVRDVVAQLGPKAEEKGLALTFEGEACLPIQANPLQLSQVALNLIENALNYTPRGAVSATLVREGERAVLTVRDTGIGIATEHVERIFERFYRVDRGRSRATGGTGLGLSIVRHIVEAHGGAVSLESALNRGSTFRAELPLG